MHKLEFVQPRDVYYLYAPIMYFTAECLAGNSTVLISLTLSLGVSPRSSASLWFCNLATLDIFQFSTDNLICFR